MSFLGKGVLESILGAVGVTCRVEAMPATYDPFLHPGRKGFVQVPGEQALGFVSLQGTLDDLWPRTPRLPPIMIRPFVAAVRSDVAIVPSPEVAAAFWVPLAALKERAAWAVRPVQVHGAGEWQVSTFLHGDYTVWGLTERVLRQFLERLGEPVD